MRRFLLLLACLLLPLALIARTDTATPLTELEALKIENVRLEGIVIQREVTDWQAKRVALIREIETARPGWTFNADSATFTKKDK